MVFGKTCSNNKKSLMPIDNHSINASEKFQNRNEFNNNNKDRLLNEENKSKNSNEGNSKSTNLPQDEQASQSTGPNL